MFWLSFSYIFLFFVLVGEHLRKDQPEFFKFLERVQGELIVDVD